MAQTKWRKAVEIVKPHVVKVRTPRGSGTGFLCAYTKDKTICGVATAAHVVSESHLWEEPIRIEHYDSRKTQLLRAADRIIYLDRQLDTAVIVFLKSKSPLPDKPLTFISEEKHIKVGIEIGWVGFPAVSTENLCFFTGINSCWVHRWKTYLIDGVAINGVSGGPAFYPTTKSIKVIGSVSSYLPNRAGATPGLAMISAVDQFQKVIKAMKDWEEAKEKETPPSELKEDIEGKKDNN